MSSKSSSKSVSVQRQATAKSIIEAQSQHGSDSDHDEEMSHDTHTNDTTPSSASQPASLQSASSTSTSPFTSRLSGLRPDGRVIAELRSPSVHLGLLSRADGSCRFAMGETEILAAVYGPNVIGGKEEKNDRAILSVNVKQPAGHAANTEIHLSNLVKSTLENSLLLQLHPRCRISIILQIIHSDGSVLSHLVNAATLALLDAGIQMKYVINAISIAIKKKDATKGTEQTSVEKKAEQNVARAIKKQDIFLSENPEDYEYVLDPVAAEEAGSPVLTFGFNNSSSGVVLSHVGNLNVPSGDVYLRSSQIAKSATNHMNEFIRNAMEQRATKS